MPSDESAPPPFDVPAGAFLRDPPPESAAWRLADWQRWFAIDLLYRMELDMHERGRAELIGQGFTALAIPELVPTWEDSERVFDRVRAATTEIARDVRAMDRAEQEAEDA